MTTPPPEREYFSLKEVSKITGKSYKSVYRAVTRGDLNAVHRHRHWTVHYTAIHEWLPPEGNSKALAAALAGGRSPAPRRPLGRLDPASGKRLDAIEARQDRIEIDLTAVSANLHRLAERVERLANVVESLRTIAAVAAKSGGLGPETDGQHFSMQKVAEMTGRSLNTVYKALITGRLKGEKGEFRWYIHKSAIQEWLSLDPPAQPDGSRRHTE